MNRRADPEAPGPHVIRVGTVIGEPFSGASRPIRQRADDNRDRLDRRQEEPLGDRPTTFPAHALRLPPIAQGRHVVGRARVVGHHRVGLGSRGEQKRGDHQAGPVLACRTVHEDRPPGTGHHSGCSRDAGPCCLEHPAVELLQTRRRRLRGGSLVVQCDAVDGRARAPHVADLLSLGPRPQIDHRCGRPHRDAVGCRIPRIRCVAAVENVPSGQATADKGQTADVAQVHETVVADRYDRIRAHRISLMT